MEQPIAPDKGIDRRSERHYELASKVRSEQALTVVIPEDKFSSYLSAGSANGFKVEKIADEGEEFPSWVPREGSEPEISLPYGVLHDKDERKSVVRNVKVKGKDNVAVSIEDLKGGKNFSYFWDNLTHLKRAKLLGLSTSPSESTTKPEPRS